MRVCTIMIYTNGVRSIYGVFRGYMRGRKFDAHSAEHVDSIEVTGPITDSFYRDTSARYATKSVPAVYWQI
jgi:hypothetical protein